MARKLGKNEIDMLHGPYARKLMQVAMPIFFVQMLQQLFNAADVAVLGQFAGDNAVAAVGANSTVVAMMTTLFTGLATGGNVCLSMHIGRGQPEKISDALHTIMALACVSGIAILALGQLIARQVLILMNTPEEILPQATLYLRLYLFAMMFAVVYNYAAAILRSIGDTKRPLYALAASGVLNILLNLFFVVGLKMDVEGVAIATIISNGVSAVATVIMLIRDDGILKFEPRKMHFSKAPLMFVLKIGVPAGLQGMLFTMSNMFVQAGINSFGPDCIAANSIASYYQFVGWFFVSAFGQAAVTFVSQNYGAHNYENCRTVIRYSTWMSFILGTFFGVIFLVFSDACMLVFTKSAEVVRLGYTRMLLTTMPEALTASYEVPAAGLRGRGLSLTPTLISIFGNVVLRIVWVNTVFVHWHTYFALLLVYPISWVLLGIMMNTVYFIKVPKMDR